MGKVTTVSIVDDDLAVHDALEQQLARQPNYRIQSRHTDAISAIDCLPRQSPDILLLDVRMPRVDGFECLHQIRDRLPATRIIIFTAYGSDDVFRHALTGRANGFVRKGTTWSNLDQALDFRSPSRIFENTAGHAQGLITHPVFPKGAPTLSPRELEILKLLARDLSNKEIADRLGITRQAVANRLWILYGKLGVHRASGAVARALTTGLINWQDGEIK